MPPRGRKRKSDQSAQSPTAAAHNAPGTAGENINAETETTLESPKKKRRVGITLPQKQALLDNLQLESKSSLAEGEKSFVKCTQATTNS